MGWCFFWYSWGSSWISLWAQNRFSYSCFINKKFLNTLFPSTQSTPWTGLWWSFRYEWPCKWCCSSVTKLQTKVFVRTLFSHCTNLCLQAVARQVERVRNALDLTMELCQLICCSLKHYSLFNTMKTEVSTATQTLKPLCPTHWTVRTKAIDAIVQNNSVLKDVLCEIQLNRQRWFCTKSWWLC